MKRIITFLLTAAMLIPCVSCSEPTTSDQAAASTAVSTALTGAGDAKPVSDDSEQVNAILLAAQKRKQEILSTPTSIKKGDSYIQGETYTGTAYYVSNNGKDKNDGLTPETAWATLGRLQNVKLKPGDAVFFERGSIWRSARMPNNVRGTKGITFSAYGAGNKPIFSGSPENGSGSEKWKLYYNGDNGVKIWEYYKEFSECSAIVLNHEIPVPRDTAYWDGTKYYCMDMRNEPQKKPYVVTEDLMDMRCFPMLLYPPLSLDERAFVKGYDENGPELVTGKLYFRCDAGNPGELYDDIEFIAPFAFFDGMSDNQTFDNLSITSSVFTFTSGFSNGNSTDNCLVQNCEVSWMGGGVTGYATFNETGDTRLQLNMNSIGRNGGGISFDGSGSTIRDNYVHNCFQEGIALETFTEDPSSMTDNVVSGNVVEECVQSILLCNWDMEVNPNHIFKNIVVENNYSLYSGKSNWDNYIGWQYTSSAFTLQGGPCGNDGTLVVRNNVFGLSEGTVILINKYEVDYSRVFKENTYIQYPGKMYIHIGDKDTKIKYKIPKYFDQYLGDEKSVILTATVNTSDAK
ncbi:MAG TPA: DUF1565 domain-containing protein [Clostridia bacterium]|nr:DUF1565 domain-containing protein [Clostridia bacterium]